MGMAAGCIAWHSKDLALYSCFQIQNKTSELDSELLLDSHKFKWRNHLFFF